MKHVGVNVAADPLFTAAYTGVGGGMVVLRPTTRECIRLKTNRTLIIMRQRRIFPCSTPQTAPRR